MKRVLAIIGIVLLLAMYLVAFIASLFHTTFASQLFMASLYCTLAVPLILWVYLKCYEWAKNSNKELKDAIKKEMKEETKEK